MTSGRKLDKRFAVPGLALLGLLVIGAEAPLEGQARQTRSSGTSTSAAPRVQSSSASAPKATSSSSTRSTAAPRASSGSGAARTRQSTPASRGRHYGGGYGHHYYPRHYHNLGWYFGYGGHWGWGGYYYPYYHYPFYWGVPYYVPRRARQEYVLGAFDLNVRPKKAEVYLDGQFIGRAGQYDGFPEHLWLEEGSYELIFYRPGLATEKRVLSIYPGVVVDVRIRMAPGESVAPSELSTVERTEGAMAEVRSAYEKQQQAAAPPPPPPPASAQMDTRAEPGRVKLNVVPADASVYLDGRLLGSGDELARLHAGLVVEPGSHLLEVVRPGYATVRREFAVEGGDEVELEILLEVG